MEIKEGWEKRTREVTQKKKKTEKFSNFRKDASTILRRPISSNERKLKRLMF